MRWCATQNEPSQKEVSGGTRAADQCGAVNESGVGAVRKRGPCGCTRAALASRALAAGHTHATGSAARACGNVTVSGALRMHMQERE